MSILIYEELAKKTRQRPEARGPGQAARPTGNEKGTDQAAHPAGGAAIVQRKGPGRNHHQTNLPQSRHRRRYLFNYFETKEDLALYFFQKETDHLIAWFSAEKRLQKAALPEKLFAIIHRQLEYLEPYEEFIGAVFCRSLQPASSLSPLSLDSQELRLKYLRFIRDILDEAGARREIPRVGGLGAYAVGLFYLGIVAFWLQDRSRGKQKTLALLDRALNLGAQLAKKGSWEW